MIYACIHSRELALWSKFDNSSWILFNNVDLRNGLPPTDSSIEFHLSWSQPIKNIISWTQPYSFIKLFRWTHRCCFFENVSFTSHNRFKNWRRWSSCCPHFSHDAPDYNSGESTTATNRSTVVMTLIFLFATTKGKLPYLVTVSWFFLPKNEGNIVLNHDHDLQDINRILRGSFLARQ